MAYEMFSCCKSNKIIFFITTTHTTGYDVMVFRITFKDILLTMIYYIIIPPCIFVIKEYHEKKSSNELTCSVFQPILGSGNARDAGLQIAKGKYHLCADADSIYPENYIDEMIEPLELGDAICTYGRVSFLPDGDKSRFSLSLYEIFKDIAISLRAIKRPELVAGGSSLAFFTRMGKQIGWRTDVAKGEDGQMVLAMKRFGNVKMVKTNGSRIWTTARTIDRDGSSLKLIGKRVKKEISRVHFYFIPSKQNA